MNTDMLKLIAMLTMLVDHIGLLFFPEIMAFRIVGRIAMPLFAYGIAQGYQNHCRFTAGLSFG